MRRSQISYPRRLQTTSVCIGVRDPSHLGGADLSLPEIYFACKSKQLYMCIYIYIYIYVCVCVYVKEETILHEDTAHLFYTPCKNEG